MKKTILGLYLFMCGTYSFAQSTINVDVSKVAATVDPYAVGLCLSYPTDDDNYFPQRVQSHAQALSTMKVKTLRCLQAI